MVVLGLVVAIWLVVRCREGCEEEGEEGWVVHPAVSESLAVIFSDGDLKCFFLAGRSVSNQIVLTGSSYTRSLGSQK